MRPVLTQSEMTEFLKGMKVIDFFCDTSESSSDPEYVLVLERDDIEEKHSGSPQPK